MIGRSWRGLAAALGCVAAALVAAAPGSAGSAAAPAVIAQVEGRPAAALAYWTQARMKAAEPLPPVQAGTGGASGPVARGLQPSFVPPAAPGNEPGAVLRDGPVATASAYSPGNESARPYRLHGRVFATYPAEGIDYSCSASVVNSPSRSLVVTAGHCVYSGSEWATNWIFVPGYRNGSKPFGRWAAKSLRATPQWVGAENISFDFGTATLARNEQGRAVQDITGARGIAFDQRRDQTYTSFGYPAEPPFDGESLQACTSPYDGADTETDQPHPMRIQCDMNGGASGGGWVVGNTLLSVNSYCTGLVLVCAELPPRLYGPYLSTDAKSLYLRSRGRSTSCAGRQVTHLTGAGAQTLTGSARRDSMRLGAGPDTAIGAGGRDTLCGGAGRDVLRGGRGRDVCVGGPGRDAARGCEVRVRIP